MHLASLTHHSTGLPCLVDPGRIAAVLPVIPGEHADETPPGAVLYLADCNGRAFSVRETPEQVWEALAAAQQQA